MPESAGFPEDPEGPLAKYLDLPCVRLTDLDESRCLLLFGDSGMGKSTEIRGDAARHAQNGTPHLYVDLGAAERWADVEVRIESNEDLQQWRKDPSRPFFLLIDGVDEVAASMSVLSDRLPQLLGTLPLDKLRLRVAGRAYAFPTRLADALTNMFTEGVEQYDLLPLTQSNVRQAAVERGWNDDQFLDQILALDIGVVASRPITLNLLLGRDQTKPLTTSKVDLYQEGTRRLVRESNDRILDTVPQVFPVEDLVQGAQKLAAVSVFAAQAAITVKRRSSDDPGPVALDEAADDGEDANLLRAVTASSLFGVSSAGTVRWTHRDFAEFLTAQRLAEMATADAVALLADPNDRRVVPQLAGTAAWTAQLHEGVFDWLVESEPELLATRAIVPTVTSDQRRTLVGRLLDRVESAPRVDVPRMGAQINYPELTADVVPYLDSRRSAYVRREAARILHDAQRHELDDQLVAIVETAGAGDPNAYDNEVSLAVSVVANLRGDLEPGIVDRLVAVVADPGAPFEIRRTIVDVLADLNPMPDLLSAVSAAGLTDAPEAFLDEVGHALARAVIARRVSVETLTTWVVNNDIPTPAGQQMTVEEMVTSGQLPEGWFALVIACVVATAAHPDAVPDALFAGLAGRFFAVLNHIDYTDRSAAQQLKELPVDQRRRMMTAVLEAHPDRRTAFHLWRVTLLTGDDFEWALTRYGNVSGDDLVEAYETCAIVTRPSATAENRDLVTGMAADNERAQAFVDRYYSDEAIRETAAAIENQERQAREQEEHRRRYDFDSDRLAAAVSAASWSDVEAELAKPIGQQQWAVGASLTEAPAWKQLDVDARKEIVELAVTYLNALTSEPTRQQVGLVGAAFTLADEQRESPAGDPAILAAWFPMVLAEPGQYRSVLAMAKHLEDTHPDEVEAAYLDALAADRTRGFSHTTHLLGTFSTCAIENALVETATDPKANSLLTNDAIAALADRNEQQAAVTALALVRARPATKPERPAPGEPETADGVAWGKAVGAAAALATSPAIGDHLDELLTELSASPEYATDVISAVDMSNRRVGWAHLATQQLGKLYEWAINNLPAPPAYRSGVVYDVVPVHDFPRYVRDALRSRPAPDTVAELNRLAQALNDDWLSQIADEVIVNIREATWQPLQPRDVVEVLRAPERRVITTEAQLVEVLLTALVALADDIGTNTNRRALYWHRQHTDTKPTFYIPLDEPEFMIRLAWHLGQYTRGVNLWHEVELNHRLGPVKGSEADILATVQIDTTTVSVVIEGKGNWHGEVKTAIDTQLAERYLTGNPTFTGIYVVGAFHSDRWLPADSRRQKAQARDTNDLRDHLNSEAARLTAGAKTVKARVIDFPLDPATDGYDPDT